jgi:predicted amidophosphoribosyltransferase
MVASHETDDRPGVAQIAANMLVDEAVAEPEPTRIALFDDVLTTGAHFVAAKKVLRARFPNAKVHGFFLARRAINADLDC